MHFPSPRPFRKKINWLIALAVEAAAPVLRAWAVSKTGPPSRDGDPRMWRKALIVGDNHIGDLLYRSASLDALKAGLPGCELHYLVAPGSCGVIERHPAITRLLPWLRSDSPLDIAPEHMDQLRATGFDAILCTNCIKYWPELLLGIRLGIRNRVGYTYKGFSGWVTHPVPLVYPQSFPAYFRGYVAALTSRSPDWPVRPVIYTMPEDEAAAALAWDALELPGPLPVVACFVTSRQPTGIWPAENFARALQLVLARREIAVLLCGATGDRAVLDDISTRFSLGARVIAGRLDIRALSRLLRRCSLVFTTDSGPRHIANAAGAPVIFVRNTWFNPVEAGPYCETETDLCPLPSAAARGVDLLDLVSPDAAAASILELLRPLQTP